MAGGTTRQPDRRLLLFLARHAAMGIAVGWLILGGLVRLDIGRIGQLLAGSEDAALWLVLAAGGFAVTFGSLAMATAIFLLPKE